MNSISFYEYIPWRALPLQEHDRNLKKINSTITLYHFTPIIPKNEKLVLPVTPYN